MSEATQPESSAPAQVLPPSPASPNQTPFEVALHSTQLDARRRLIILNRYVPLLRILRRRAARVSVYFHTLRTVVTVGSLLVPALLSIQNSTVANISVDVYWATWIVSLLVTISNGLQALFKIDKKYYQTNTVMEQLISEGWQYIGLTAKYSGFYTPKVKPTHENQFVYFCHAIEKIWMRQVEEEYYKLGMGEAHSTSAEQRTSTTNGTATTSLGQPSAAQTQNGIVPSTSLIPQTPLQEEIARISEDVRRAVQEQLSRAQIDGVEPAPRRQGQGFQRQPSAQNLQSEENREATSVSVQQ